MIRRILALCIALMLALPAVYAEETQWRAWTRKQGYQYILLGEFPQGKNGEREPILWRVLSPENGELYLLSEYILLNGRIHHDDNEYIANGGAWNTTDMYYYLNGDFLKDAFSDEEAGWLLFSEELGYVTLPSYRDLHNESFGFVANSSRFGYGTPYTLNYDPDEAEKDSRLYKGYPNGSSPYWTRSQHSNKYGTICTKVKGNTGYIRCVKNDIGVRPVIRLSQLNLTVLSGEGTKESPFRISYSAEAGQ